MKSRGPFVCNDYSLIFGYYCLVKQATRLAILSNYLYMCYVSVQSTVEREYRKNVYALF